MPTCLVTGSSRGIGHEFAKQYAAEGWEVIATCRRQDQSGALRQARGDVRVKMSRCPPRRSAPPRCACAVAPGRGSARRGCGRPTAAVGLRSAARRSRPCAGVLARPGHDIRGDASQRTPARPADAAIVERRHEVVALGKPLRERLVIVLLDRHRRHDQHAGAAVVRIAERRRCDFGTVAGADRRVVQVEPGRPPVRRVRRYLPRPCRYLRTSSPCRISDCDDAAHAPGWPSGLRRSRRADGQAQWHRPSD